MQRRLIGLAAFALMAIVLPKNAMAIGLPKRLPLFVNLFSLFQVTPANVALASSDPDGAGGTSTGTAVWGSLLGLFQSTWTLSVSAAASQVTNCPQVSLSAFRIVCSSVVTSGINSPTSSCGSASSLSTTPQILASGTDGQVVNALASHIVTFSINFTDSWKYPATTSACSIPLTYTLDVR